MHKINSDKQYEELDEILRNNRQLEILQMYKQEKGLTQIAEELNISRNTVWRIMMASHLSNYTLNNENRY